jgi:AcrR family transcriptional regulator
MKRPPERKELATTKRWRYDGDLARALLDAAADHLATEGAVNLSLRSLARELGVSHAAPAAHFKDKRGLLTSLAEEGFQQLGSRFDEVWADTEGVDPAERVQALGRAYTTFAFENPGHYAVMFRPDMLNTEEDEFLTEPGATLFDSFRQLVARAQQQGWAQTADSDTLAATLWASAHGLVDLLRSGALAKATGIEGREEIVERALVLLTGLVEATHP